MDVVIMREYILKLTEKEYNLLALCVAHCAGIKEAKPTPKEASAVNILLVKIQERVLAEQHTAIQKRLEKAEAHHGQIQETQS